MWFLEADIFSRMVLSSVLLCLVSVLSCAIFKKNVMKHLLLPIDLLLIGYVSVKLCAFYVVYTLITFLFVKILKNVKHLRKTLFVLLCLLCTVPFFYSRFTSFFDFLPEIFLLVGFSYNMLKAVDALYFTYYADTDIPLYTYANYMLFFPVITSGPIFRYRDFAKSFDKPKEIKPDLCEKCVKRVIKGLFKKMVALYFVNNYLLFVVEKGEFDTVYSLVVIALSYVALYLDLSGYSDIAIGLGSITGIIVPENFKKPWLSPSFTVFWRNWHVTLSDFIREHIFVVLNGKKLNRFVSALIGFCTMFVMALWHGFTNIFVVSGVYNGLLLAIENLFGITRADKKKHRILFYVRCLVVSFLFGINSMIFLFDFDTIFAVLKGLIGM